MLVIPVKANPSAPLPEVTVGRASALAAKIVGVPADFSSVQVAFGVPGGGSFSPCPCSPRKGGDWGLYASGAFFLTEGKAAYHVTARTRKGDSAWLGCGTLRVVPSVLNVEATDVPVLPDECYVRGADGLYYKVTAELDEDGVPYMVVSKEGITK